MRRLWAACAMLLALLLLSLGNARYIRQLTGQTADLLERAQALAQAGDWAQAEQFTQDAHRIWEDSRFYLHAAMRHQDTDQILRSFRQVRQNLADRDWNQYAPANADLMLQLRLLSDKEAATLDNVL